MCAANKLLSEKRRFGARRSKERRELSVVSGFLKLIKVFKASF